MSSNPATTSEQKIADELKESLIGSSSDSDIAKMLDAVSKAFGSGEFSRGALLGSTLEQANSSLIATLKNNLGILRKNEVASRTKSLTDLLSNKKELISTLDDLTGATATTDKISEMAEAILDSHLALILGSQKGGFIKGDKTPNYEPTLRSMRSNGLAWIKGQLNTFPIKESSANAGSDGASPTSEEDNENKTLKILGLIDQVRSQMAQAMAILTLQRHVAKVINELFTKGKLDELAFRSPLFTQGTSLPVLDSLANYKNCSNKDGPFFSRALDAEILSIVRGWGDLTPDWPRVENGIKAAKTQISAILEKELRYRTIMKEKVRFTTFFNGKIKDPDTPQTDDRFQKLVTSLDALSRSKNTNSTISGQYFKACYSDTCDLVYALAQDAHDSKFPNPSEPGTELQWFHQGLDVDTLVKRLQCYAEMQCACWTPEFKSSDFEKIVDQTLIDIENHGRAMIDGRLAMTAYLKSTLCTEAAKVAHTTGTAIRNVSKAAGQGAAKAAASSAASSGVSGALRGLAVEALPIIGTIALVCKAVASGWVLYKWKHRRTKMENARDSLRQSVYAGTTTRGLHKLADNKVDEHVMKSAMAAMAATTRAFDVTGLAGAALTAAKAVATAVMSARIQIQLAQQIDRANEWIKKNPKEWEVLAVIPLVTSYLPMCEAAAVSALGGKLNLKASTGKKIDTFIANKKNALRDTLANKGLTAAKTAVPSTVGLDIDLNNWIFGPPTNQAPGTIDEDQARAFYDICHVAEKLRKASSVHFNPRKSAAS